MAIRTIREQFTNATIDCSDGTLTEFQKETVNTYSIDEILKRWSGVPNVTLTIEQCVEQKRGETVREPEVCEKRR